MRTIKFRAWDIEDKRMIDVGDIHKLLWAFGSEDNWERTNEDDVYRHLGYMRRCGRKWHFGETPPICQEYRSKYPDDKAFIKQQLEKLIDSIPDEYGPNEVGYGITKRSREFKAQLRKEFL